MLLERALLGNAVMSVRRQDISRRWFPVQRARLSPALLCRGMCILPAFEETGIPGEKNLPSFLFVSY